MDALGETMYSARTLSKDSHSDRVSDQPSHSQRCDGTLCHAPFATRFGRAAVCSGLLILVAAHADASSFERIAMKERATETTLTVVSGGISTTSAKMARDLGAVLNDDDLRILTVVGYGGFHNVSDVLHLAGVDAGFVHEDVLAALKRDEVFPNMDNRLRSIIRLNREPIFIIARAEIANLDALDGKTVNLGPGSTPLYDPTGKVQGKTMTLASGAQAQHSTPALVLEALGLHVTPTFFELADALEKMRNGSVDAAVLIGTELTAIASHLNADDRLRVVPITRDRLLRDGAPASLYEPVVISGGEYADILPAGSQMHTISVPVAMVTVNWPRTSVQYDKVARFAVSLFDNFGRFLSDARSPAWKEVDLAASVPGFQRFEPAAEWIAANAAASHGSVGSLARLEGEFQAFLSSANIGRRGDLSSADRAVLFEQFLTWPQNPAEIEIPLHRVDGKADGRMIGTLTVRNTETSVLGQLETGLLFRPDLIGLEPARRYAVNISDQADCRGPRDGGIAVASLTAAGDLWAMQAKENNLNEAAKRDRREFGADLPNLPDLVGNDRGRATEEFVVTGMSLADLMQRSIVVQAGDDPNASRWACAAIGFD